MHTSIRHRATIREAYLGAHVGRRAAPAIEDAALAREAEVEQSDGAVVVDPEVLAV